MSQESTVTATGTATGTAEGPAPATPTPQTSVDGAEPPGPAPHTIGPYRVLRLLGRGGMGEVWLGEAADGQRVAIKRAAHRRHTTALRREAQALAGFDHPGVARLLDRGVSDGRLWYAMRHVDGPTLDRAARGRALPARLTLLVHLCETLAALHRAGGVHRDVKPANVLVEGDRAILIDFGLLLPVGGERADLPGWARDRVFGAPDAAGTRGYRAPEQAAGGWVDGRADLYAVGRILGDWLGPDDPPPLHALARALQAARPTDRPADAADVARRLARFASIDAAAVVDRLATLPPALHRTALVGRSAIHDTLAATLRAVAAGAGRAVVLDGPSGIGKTRLALEAARMAQGFRRVAAECRSDGGLLHGLRPLIELAIDRCRGHAGRTAAVFGAGGPTLQPFAPGIADLPGQADHPARRPDLDAVVQALTTLLDGLTARRPLLVLVDDAHAADRLTAAVLRRVLGHARVLWILTTRAEAPHPDLAQLDAHPAVTVQRIAPLAAAAAAALVGELLGWPDPPPARVAEVVERAQGNPFFIAECLRAALAEGRLDLAARRWRAPPPGLPEPVEITIRRRLVDLGPDAQRLLEAAAVLGEDARPLRIRALCGAEPAAETLRTVVGRAVCVWRGDRLRFTHHRLRAVTYAGLDPALRGTLHRRAADDLAARPPADGYVAARSVAHHRDRAGQPVEAGRALRAAAALADARGALDDAITDFAAAAKRLGGPERIETRLDQARVLEMAGRRRVAAEQQQAAVDDARVGGHPALQARALSALGRSLEFVGRLPEALDALERSVQIYTALDDRQGLALGCSRLALFHQHRGALDRAEALHLRSLALNEESGHRFGVVASANNLAVLAGDRGRYAAAVEHVDRALAALDGVERPGTVLLVRSHRAYALHRAGRVDAALPAYDACLADLASAQMHPQRAMALLRRAGLRRQIGDPVEAGFAALDEAAEVLAEVDAPLSLAALACERGHHLMARGHAGDGPMVRAAVAEACARFERLDINRHTPSLAGWMLGWLQDAHARFEAGAGGALWAGQVWGSVFPGVRAWLTARGRGPDVAQSATQ